MGTFFPRLRLQTLTMELCNGDKCLRNDTLIVLCYALFCICFGLMVATLVVALDKRRNRKAKKSMTGVEGPEATSNGDQRPTETSEEVKKTLDKLDVVGKFTGKLEDR